MINFFAVIAGGLFGGVVATIVTNFFSFRRMLWEKKRHNYGNLLIALSSIEDDPGKLQIVREKIELVALIGPKNIREKVFELKNQINTKNYFKEKDSKELFKNWHSDLSELMYKDIHSKLFLNWSSD